MRRVGGILLAGLCAAVPAAAQEDSDLARIPGAVDNTAAPAPDISAHGKYFIEDAFSYSSYRGSFAVPYPYSVPSRWANRTSLDILDQWALSENLTANVSDRLSATFSDGSGFPNDVVRNDPREAYLTWEPAPQTYFEIGRINVRTSVAYGYNPTDFFRTRTTVSQSSADPGAARQNRLGTVMLRAQHIFESGSFEFIYAPKLHKAPPIGTNAGPFDPRIDQTNGADRFLATFSFDLEEFSPQLLVYHESGRTQFGLNVSHPVGNSIIAYASWAGGNAQNLIAEAIGFGKKTGTFPSFMPVLPPAATGSSFQNDLSTGAYWTGEDKITLSLEYNFHQAGFSKTQWRSWFATGANPSYSSLMWYIRGYNSEIQQPATRHQAFARFDWQEPLQFEHFDVNAFVMTDLSDGSSLGQIAASYDISDRWSIAAYYGGSIGGKRSEWGSLRSDTSAIIQLVRYL